MCTLYQGYVSIVSKLLSLNRFDIQTGAICHLPHPTCHHACKWLSYGFATMKVFLLAELQACLDDVV